MVSRNLRLIFNPEYTDMDTGMFSLDFSFEWTYLLIPVSSPFAMSYDLGRTASWICSYVLEIPSCMWRCILYLDYNTICIGMSMLMMTVIVRYENRYGYSKRCNLPSSMNTL
jgi:hypothetical protein